MIATVRLLDGESAQFRPLIEEAQEAEWDTVQAATDAAVDLICREVTPECLVYSGKKLQALVRLDSEAGEIAVLRRVGCRAVRKTRRPRLDLEASGKGAVCASCGGCNAFRASDAYEDEGIKPVAAMRCRANWRCGWCGASNPVTQGKQEATTCRS